MKQLARTGPMSLQRRLHGPFAASVIGAVCLFGILGSTATARTVSAPTYLKLSATRAGDGTITAKGVFTSPNRHCLSANRFKLYQFQGNSHLPFHYTIAGGVLAYGEPAFGEPFGNNGYGNTSSFGEGWLHPASPFARSPMTWEAVWPGGAEVSVTQQGTPEAPHNPSLPFKYSSTVVAAAGLILSSDGLGNGSDATSHPGHRMWKTTYRQGKHRIVLECKPSGHVEQRSTVTELGSS